MPRTWPPARAGFEWRRKRIAGDHLDASLYALPPDQATFPYHYELRNDELLVVVSGSPTLRIVGHRGGTAPAPAQRLTLPAGTPCGNRRAHGLPATAVCTCQGVTVTAAPL